MILYILVITGLVILDQLTKFVIVKNIALYKSIEIIPNFFSLTNVRNTGSAWSMFEGKMNFFYLVTLISLGIFIYLLVTEGDMANKKLLTFSLLLMIAGTIGNFIDRLLLQYVVDFLEFNIFGYHFPVFNVADICLTLGTIGFAYTVLFTKKI